MAFCAYCGNQMSDQATSCPNCGHPNELRAPVAAARPAGSLAGFWRRFVAVLIDGAVLSVVSLAFRVGSRGYLGYPGIGFGFLYRWLMLSFANGQTLGKMALGIRIAKPDGSRIDIGQAAAREGMAIVSALAILLGYLWAIWDDEKRTWHDMVANTRAFKA
jgi:uncharacterized RDD family membrane protein YckC